MGGWRGSGESWGEGRLGTPRLGDGHPHGVGCSTGTERSGEADARVLDKQDDAKRKPGFTTELHAPQRYRKRYRRVQEGCLEALGSGAAFASKGCVGS